MLLLPPKLTVASPSAPIPTADPRPLFWVTGVVLGLLALWVLYVVFTGETRKARRVNAEDEQRRSEVGRRGAGA